MNLSIRKLIYRIKPLHRLCERIVDYNNYLFYKNFNRKYKSNYEKLSNLKSSSNKKRCFIVGNGPSLLMSDLEKIRGEDCFAANLIYKIFDKTLRRPKYYFIQDRYADTNNDLDYLNIEFMFIGAYYWRKRGFNNKNGICFLNKRRQAKKIAFSDDITKFTYDCYTVTYTMIQFAIYFGYKEICLLGMDHNYKYVVNSDGKVEKNDIDSSHVFSDKNERSVIANLEGMNAAYLKAREIAQGKEIKIYNCTRGGKLEWFERRDLEECLKDE